MDSEQNYLIQVVTVLRGHYDPSAVEAAKLKLAEQGVDITQFDENFYIERIASCFGDGWKHLIRAMMDELRLKGWNKDMAIRWKEKYGRFEFELIEQQNLVLNEIIERHLNKINQSCETCGAPGTVVSIPGIWDSSYCREHYLQHYPIILNIDDSGFVVNEIEYIWSEILNIRIYVPLKYDDDGNILEPNAEHETANILNSFADISFNDTRESIVVSHEWMNWFLFLKKIPSRLRTERLDGLLENFERSLTCCPVCQHQAVVSDRCLRCNHWIESLESQKQRAKKRGRVFDEVEFILRKRDLLNNNWIGSTPLELEKYFKPCNFSLNIIPRKE